MLPLVRQLGRATAKIHCVSDAGSGGHPLVAVEVEEAITAVIGDRVADFAADLAAFGAAYGALPATTTAASWTRSATGRSGGCRRTEPHQAGLAT